MRKTMMLKKECFSNVKKTWDRLCRPDISKQLCTSVSPKQSNNNKDWFLYFNMHNRLCRLRMRDFCENQGSSKYELIHDYYPGFPPNTIPTDMEPVIVGSKVYMWGGKSASNEIFNLNVYSFHPSGDPPFRLCEGPISRLIPPKFHDLYSDIRVLSTEEKIYVLDLPLIRVFDTVHQSWKDLPHLPCLPDTNFRWFRHFFCGHKIFISLYSCDTAGYDRVHGGSYIFDTREEKWEATSTIRYDVIKWFQSPAIEFKGFLIAVMRYCYKHYEKDKVIAYKLDSNGIPNWESCQVLHEISEKANYYCYYYLSKCDGLK